MLTLSMIVKNEEKFLAGCLDSVKDVVDEIVIVDTGSTDNTLKIAESFNAKIFNFNWMDDFSAARNFALDKSSGDWVLYLDADERLMPDSISELKKIKRNAADYAYYCTIYNEDEVNKRPSLMNYPRLFPNRKRVRFEGKVHEQIEPALLKNDLRIKRSGIQILHLGYSHNKDKIRQKAERNLNILLTEYNSNPSAYTAYQIAQSYGMLNQKQDAEKYFHIAIKDPALRSEYKSIALRYLASNEAERNNFIAAYEKIKRSISIDPKQPLALLIASIICIKLGLNDEASGYVFRAFTLNLEYLDKKSFTFQSIFLDEETLFNESIILALEIHNEDLISKILNECRHRNNELYNHYYNAIHGNICEESVTGITENVNSEIVIKLIQRNPSKEEQISNLKKLREKFPGDSVLLNTLGGLYHEQNKLSEAVEVYESLFETKPVDASVIFYLTSLYLQTGVAEKIPPLLQESESYYGNIPEVKAKLAVLKEKLGLIN